MMKKIIACVLIMISLGAWNTAFGNEFQPSQRGFGPPPPANSESGMPGDETGMPPRPPKGGSLGLLVKYQQDNMAVGVISEITGQSADSILAGLETQQIRDILDDYGIDRETFENAMDAKAIVFIGKAVESGSITQDQADDIIEKINNRPQIPETDSIDS